MHRGRRHVPTGVAEDAVVEEQRRHLLAPGRRVQHLVQALAHHVAVTLERDDGRLGLHPLDAGGDRGRPAVEALQRVDVADLHHLGVAPVPGDEDGAAGQLELDQRVEHQAPGHGCPHPGQRSCSEDWRRLGLNVGHPVGGAIRCGRDVDGGHATPLTARTARASRLRSCSASLAGATGSPTARRCADGPRRRSTGHLGACPTRPGTPHRSIV